MRRMEDNLGGGLGSDEFEGLTSDQVDHKMLDFNRWTVECWVEIS